VALNLLASLALSGGSHFNFNFNFNAQQKPGICCSSLEVCGYSQQYAMMTIAPENKPPVPIPAIALPTINATLLGAVAHTRELLHD
jgi:hypothetical protein